MRTNAKRKKLLSSLLCLCVLLQNCPVAAFAAETDGLCDHHTQHTAECGYSVLSPGSACIHDHGEECYEIVACQHTHGDCGYAEAVEPQDCTTCQSVLVHGENCGYVAPVAEVPCACPPGEDGSLTHAEGCGYVATVAEVMCACEPTVTHAGEGCTFVEGQAGSPCTHVCSVETGCCELLCSHKDGSHDDACGYAQAVEAHECQYECAECNAFPSGEGGSPEGLTDEVMPVCDCGTDDASYHATTCPVYVAPETAVCHCVEKCTEANVWCDVCGFDYTQCGGEDAAAAYEDPETCTHTPGENATYTVNDDGTTAEITLTAPTARSGLKYSGAAQNLVESGSVSAENMAMAYAVSYAKNTIPSTFDKTVPSDTGAGTYYVYWKIVDAQGNDVIPASVSNCIEVTIAKAKLTVTANHRSITYGEEPGNGSVTYSGFVNNETESVLGGSLAFECAYTKGNDVGNYTITPKGLTSDNYEIAFVSGTLYVLKADTAYTAPDAKTLTYNGQAQALVTEGKTNDGTMLYSSLEDGTYGSEVPAATNAGKYTVWYKVVGDENHKDVAPQRVEVTINTREIMADDVKLNGSLTYTGSEQTQEITVTDGITYEVTGNKATNADEYTLTVRGTGGNCTGSVDVEWNIAKAPVTITADNKVIYIGVELPELTYTVSGLVNGEKLTNAPTLTTDAVKDKAGSYAITVADANAGDNYEITYVNGTLTIMDKNTEVDTKIEKSALTAEDTTNPKTGDEFPLILWSSMAVTSLLCMAVLVLGKKKCYQK